MDNVTNMRSSKEGRENDISPYKNGKDKNCCKYILSKANENTWTFENIRDNNKHHSI